MNLTKLQTVLGKAGRHLGSICFWQLSDARVNRATLERLWRDAGLDLALLPEEPTCERAIKQAAREAQVGQRDRLIRLGRESEAEIVFAVVRERRDNAGNVTYVQEARVHLDRMTETVTTDAHGHEIVQAMFAAYNVLRTTHVADDVRRAIVRTLTSWSAVTLRDGGGVYFITAPYAQSLRSLQSAIERLGSSHMHLLPVNQSEDADRSLGALAVASLESELASLQAEIAAFLTTPPERASTLQRRLDAFDALRSRARLYRSVLNVQVVEIDQSIDRMASTIEGLLAAKDKAA